MRIPQLLAIQGVRRLGGEEERAFEAVLPRAGKKAAFRAALTGIKPMVLAGASPAFLLSMMRGGGQDSPPERPRH